MALETCSYHAGVKVFGFGTGFWIQILIILAFFAILYWVISGQGLISKTPQEILDFRLAKGEITKKEFEDLKKSLK